MTVFALALAGAIGLLAGLVLTRPYGIGMDQGVGVQKLHHQPTPRLGGVALGLGVMVGSCLLPPETRALFWALALGALPAFGAGLAEDLTGRIPVPLRFAATLAAGCVAVWSLGLSEGPWWFVGLLVVGIAMGSQSFNLIDGVNGLALGCGALAFGGFGLLALWHGVVDLAVLNGLFLCATLGVLGVNYPSGRLFLGDGGAYGLGFAVAVSGLLLGLRIEEIGPSLALLGLCYPLSEVGVTILRRLMGGHGVTLADRGHLHSRLYALLEGLGGFGQRWTGPILCLLPLLTFGLYGAALWLGISVFWALGVGVLAYLWGYLSLSKGVFWGFVGVFWTRRARAYRGG